MKIHPNALAAKVAAVNAAHSEAKRLYPLLVAAFKPFYGQRVTKVNGDLLAKVEKALPKLPSYADTNNRMTCYYDGWSHTIRFCLKVSENFETGNGYQSTVYHDVTLYVCDLDNGLASPPTGGDDWILSARTDYNEAEIILLRSLYKKAKEEADKTKSALVPFGEYDR